MNNGTILEAKFRRRFLSLTGVAVLSASVAVMPVAANPTAGHALPKGMIQAATVQRRLIEVTADKDNRFHAFGQPDPSITVYAGEGLRLRITAAKAKNHTGGLRSFALFRTKDHTAVAGWDIALHTGTHDHDVTAPFEPGEYELACTAACGADQDPMTMRFIVVPRE